MEKTQKNKTAATEQSPVAELPKETVIEQQQTTNENGDIMRLLTADSRIAHLVADILSGRDPDDAVASHFPSKIPDNIEEMKRQAEQQGYLRGRNEAVDLHMNSRSLWESDTPEASTEPSHTPVSSFLRRIHRSIWDK